MREIGVYYPEYPEAGLIFVVNVYTIHSRPENYPGTKSVLTDGASEYYCKLYYVYIVNYSFMYINCNKLN